MAGALTPTKPAMKKGNKLRLARWVAIPLVILGLRFIGGGRVWEYMTDHLVLTALLPLVVLFLVLFVRIMTMQHRREPDERAKVGGAHRAKP
jgi:small-conductance mechanosensitive channel